MELITLLASPEEVEAGELKVEGDAYRHLFRARRVEAGTTLRVVDGRGRARWGEVARVDRASAQVKLAGPAPANEPEWRLELLVATIRPEPASWVVEKATEVGVAAIRFLNTARAPRTFGEGTAARLVRVAAAAVEQCHRSVLPDVTGPHAWSEMPRLAARSERRWVLDTAAEVSEVAAWGDRGESGSLLVGPEGGWSPEERQELAAAGWRPVGLGARVLRAETAALVGAGMLILG